MNMNGQELLEVVELLLVMILIQTSGKNLKLYLIMKIVNFSGNIDLRKLK